MTLRIRFLITALFLCHQLPASSLVTSQLLAENSGQSSDVSAPTGQQKTQPAATPCASQAANEDSDQSTICATAQEKDGDIYKLHGNAEIHYRDYVLRADEVTYNSDSGEATASGHVTLDGGPDDDHIKASHGTYNVTAETGRFYDVTGSTGVRFNGNRVILTSTSPFSFTGKIVEKPSSGHYLVYDGTITTCELPHPKWQFQARKVSVDVGGNATIHHSTFWLHEFPVFYFPYATHPVARGVRESGFLIPTIGRSSSKGEIVGENVYWAINRSMDALLGAQYFSHRGWSQRGEFRARPSDSSYVDLDYFGVIDRGIGVETSTAAGCSLQDPCRKLLREGGQEVRLNAESNFYGFRAVSNIDYLSSFIFRLAFSEVFTQAVNSEVKSQAFMSKAANGFSFGGTVERYQNFFERVDVDNGVPAFDDVRILHAPSIDASSVDRPLAHSPFVWSFDASIGGLARSEPGFRTSNLLGRFDFNPEVALPLQFKGWSLRPALTLHETYYTQRFVNNVSVKDPTNRQALETSVELRPPVLEKIFDKEFLGRKWKHVIEPRAVYRMVTGVNDFANVLHFDERDLLSNTHEVEYGFVTRLYAKRTSLPTLPSQNSSRNSSREKSQDCDATMTGLSVGGAPSEQIVPWEHVTNLDHQSCASGPEVKEVATWELSQKYFLDPTFGGALVPGLRNVFTATEDLTGIAFITEPRHLSPIVSRVRVATSAHTDTEWDLDYDFQLSRFNASTLLVNYNLGPFTVGGGDAFLQIPQPPPSAITTGQSEGQCTPATSTATQPTCKFQQFRVALGYGSLVRRGVSAASSFGFDSETGHLQFVNAQTTYNWDCCGVTLEYRRYAIANVRNENLFRFTFTLANLGSIGNLRRQERLY
jgi:LPS-assembly protein